MIDDPVKNRQISIHAPAGGATRASSWLKTSGEFQSTLPRGERLRRTGQPVRRKNFNPRSRGGSDPRTPRQLCHSKISIHAPAGGATRARAASLPTADISIHAPAGGATVLSFRRRFLMGISIHAPAGGATM